MNAIPFVDQTESNVCSDRFQSAEMQVPLSHRAPGTDHTEKKVQGIHTNDRVKVVPADWSWKWPWWQGCPLGDYRTCDKWQQEAKSEKALGAAIDPSSKLNSGSCWMDVSAFFASLLLPLHTMKQEALESRSAFVLQTCVLTIPYNRLHDLVLFVYGSLKKEHTHTKPNIKLPRLEVAACFLSAWPAMEMTK